MCALLLIAGVAGAGTDTLSVPYFIGFEGSAPGWLLTGGWHPTTSPQSVSVDPAIADSLVDLPGGTSWPSAVQGNGVMALADEVTGTYIEPWEVEDQVTGNGGESQSARTDTLTSPCFVVPPGETVRFSFDTWWEVEAFDIFGSDLLQVEYSSDGGANWTIIDILSVPGSTPSSDPADAYTSGGIGVPGVWTPKTYTVNTGAGQPRFRFLFRSVTKDRNGFRGWFIDDLSVACEGLFEPYGLSATDDECAGVLVAWSDTSTADPIGYEVERRELPGGARDTVAVTSTTWLDTTATAGTSYEYRVRGASTCGLTAFTAVAIGSVPADPDPPTGVTASEGDCSEITIDWVEPAIQGDGYVIERAGVRIDTVGNGVTSYVDGGAAGGVPLAYRVGTLGTCDPVYSVADTGSRLADPPPVTFVSATDDLCDVVNVAWVAVANTSEYVVYRDGDSIGVVDSLTTQYEDALAESTITHVYSVRSRTDCGLSGVTSTDTGSRIGRAPSVVSCDASDALCEEIVVSWTPSPDPGNLTGFAILREGIAIDSVTSATTIYRDSSSLIDTVLQYEVFAYNPCGYSVAACVDSGLRETTPPTPAGVSASDDRCPDVRVTWTDVAGEIESYVVFRDGDSIGAVAAADSSVFYDSGIDSTVTASYTVRSRSSCGLSAASNADTGSRLGAPPPARNCVATDGFCGRVTVTWESAIDPGVVNRYVLFRDGDSIDVKTGPPFTFTDVNGPPNEPVLYEVRTWNSCGYSVSSAADSGTTISAPGMPSGFEATRTLCGVVELTWQPPATGGPVDGYRVVRGSPPVTVDLPADSLRYVDTSPPGGLVEYSLRAFNCEESGAVLDTGNTVNVPPDPPAACSLETVGCSGYRVHWEAPPGAVNGYLILRNGARIDSVGPTTDAYLDLGLGTGADYLYEVFSVNNCGPSLTSCATSARLPGPVNSPPDGSCTATLDSCPGVFLDWQAATIGQDVAWFRIFDAESGTEIDSVGREQRSYLDSTLPFGGERLYAIVAGNDCFTAAEGCTIIGSRPELPSEPTSCGASDNLCDRVEVFWNSPADGIDDGVFAFRVYRRVNTPSGTFVLIHTEQPPRIGANSYSDFTAEEGVSYLYRIASVNKCGETFGSCTISGRRLRVRSGPTLVSPANGAQFTALPITLRWQEVSEIDRFRVELSKDAAFTDVVRDTTVNGTSLALRGIDFVTQYWWRVSSVNDCGTGSPSSVRSFTLNRAPGIDIIAGAQSQTFGNGFDSLFTDSMIVIENFASDTLAWSTPGAPRWITATPAGGLVAPGGRDTLLVGVGEYRCGEPLSDTLFIASDPLPAGREPIPIAVSLDPPPRPVGDFDWNCTRDVSDVGLVIATILGTYAPDAEDSAGGDANGDGRIGVGDLVLLSRALAETGTFTREAAGDGSSGRAGLAPSWFAKDGGEERLRITADEPVLVLRATVRFESGEGRRNGNDGDGDQAHTEYDIDDRSVRIPDGSGEVVFADRGGGRYDFVWYGLEEAARTIDLFTLDAPSALRVEALEALTASGALVRVGGDEPRVLTPASMPGRLMLSRPEPNPFARTSVVRFALPDARDVRLHVYDIRGRLKHTLVDRAFPAGLHAHTWDGRGANGEPLDSGVYFLRLESGRETRTERIVILR